MDDALLQSAVSGTLIVWAAILLCYGLFFGFVCNLAAKRKGLEGSTWAVLGFLFGLFALIGVAVIPARAAPGEASVREPKTNWPLLGCLGFIAVLIVAVFVLAGRSSPAIRTSWYTPGSPDRPRQWTTVASWRGSSIKSTETFTVGPEWKIAWDTKPGQYGAMNFQIYVYDAAGGLTGLAANIIGADHDESIQHEAGTYYLQFNSAQPYEVKVLELR